jgi:26S proteasome regulatory subunit N1
MLVQVLQESDAKLYQSSLESMKNLIRASTTSMTSVPKPLKFMMPHYGTMKQIYEKMHEGPAKKLCADVISALAMCSGEPGDCTKYRLGGTSEAIDDWGHEYVR